MDSGTLRHRGRLEKPPATLTSRGQRDRSAAWTYVAEIYFGKRTVAAGEVIRGRQVHAEATHRLTIRYRDDVTPQWRIVEDNRTYELLSVIDPDDRKRTLELDVKELV